MTKNHEIKLAKVGKHVLVSGCEKPVPTRNFRILQAEKETKTDMMNPVMQRCSCREYAETAAHGSGDAGTLGEKRTSVGVFDRLL